MKINLLFVILIILVALAFICVSDRAESLDITAITSGSMVQINPRFIIILDYRNGSNTLFKIDSNTVYDNAQKLTDFKAGDKVQVEYKINHNKNTAITITKIETEV